MSTRARSTTAVLGTASDVLAGGALLIGVTALVGWEAGVRVLSGPVPGSPPMKANAALGVALVAVAVLAYRRTAPGSPARWAAGVAAGLAAAIGIATLCEYVFGWRLGIDELLARDHTRTSAPFPGRPAANAALGCALGGFAVLAWDVRVGRLWVTHAIAAVAGGLGLLALLGYAAGTEPLIDIAAGQRIAASAAAAVALLGGALLTARPDRGITAMLASSGTGGALFRRLLPVALLLPITVAGLTLSGERLGLYGADVATWLLATVTTATLVVLAWAMAREAQRAGAERERHEHERERMAAAAEHGTDAVVSFDLAGRVRHWGPGAERLYGWTEAEAVGHPLSELIVDVDESRDQIARIVAGEPPFQYESRRRRKDGSYVDVLLTISPWHRAGELVGITGVAIDMSDQKRRQRELTALAARWRAAARELPGAALAIVDEDLRYVEMEGESLRRLGIDPEPMAGRPVEAASPNEAGPRGQFVTAYRDALDGRSSEIEHELRGHRWHTRVVGLDLGDGRRHAMALSFDVTELRESEERLRILFESAPIGVALIDAHEPYRLVQVNPALADLLGATAEELLGQGALTFVDPADHDATRAALRLLAEHHGRVELDARLLRDDGDAVWASMSISLVEGPDGAPRHHVLQILDVSERKRFEGQLQHLADHDSLTGLYNRRRFEDELRHAVAAAARYEEPAALLAIDLDDFKAVNDRHGHAVGDELLGRVAGAIRARLRETDVVGRLGGDEFAVILPRTDEPTAAAVAEQLALAVSAAHVATDEGPVHATVSIGVAVVAPGAPTTPGDLLVAADLAMYDAKESGRDRVALAAGGRGPQHRLRTRMLWSQRIEQALATDGFELVRQPIADLATGRVDRHELLLRMRDETGDLIPPGVFLGIAESTGQIRAIDRWVVARTIALLEAEQRGGVADVLEVNLSGATLTDAPTMDAIVREVAAAPIDHSKLVIEVTETAAIVNVERARSFAHRLATLGCQFALDDFGAGFGSFYYLKHLPFDALKIDGDFIRHLPSSPADQLTVKAIVDIARGMGKRTIAEFVEDEETLALLHELGVDYAQGYHVGRPEPLPDELRAILAAGSGPRPEPRPDTAAR